MCKSSSGAKSGSGTATPRQVSSTPPVGSQINKNKKGKKNKQVYDLVVRINLVSDTCLSIYWDSDLNYGLLKILGRIWTLR